MNLFNVSILHFYNKISPISVLIIYSIKAEWRRLTSEEKVHLHLEFSILSGSKVSAQVPLAKERTFRQFLCHWFNTGIYRLEGNEGGCEGGWGGGVYIKVSKSLASLL